ncbi:nuclease domain-containing protein [Kerstersia gyiorum]|uniref:nuclease domain-containing protein n=1 Tax=Kerstersia gyiorum TaxID=206506 RepID=UPI0030CCDC3F
MKKSSRRKHNIDGHHDRKMLDACRGEPCYLMVPGLCPRNPVDPTVVDCHGNWADTGKGLGLKAADRFSVPGCCACHFWLDFGTTASREEKRSVFFDALRRWEPARAKKMNPATAGTVPGLTQRMEVAE